MQKLILVLTLFLASLPAFSQNGDINLLRKINLDRNKNLDPTFKFITNSFAPVSIGVPVITYTIGLIQGDDDIKQKGIYLGEAFLVTAVASIALKNTIRRPRPFITYPDLEREVPGRGFSMPSGHTSLAFATATSLSISYPKWYVIAPSFIWAGAVGYSRMHLGVHYPSDVAVGAVVGAGSAWLSFKLNKWIRKKRNNN